MTNNDTSDAVSAPLDDAFHFQTQLSKELLSKRGVWILYKVTRAAATTTLILIALLMGLKVILIVPNKKIAQEILTTITELSGYAPSATIIRSNPEMCKQIQKNGMIFQYRADCRECPYNDPDKCDFQSLMAGSFDLIALTYHKLSALFSNNESFAAKNILEKIRSADVVIFDEFSAATLPKIATIPIVTKDEQGNVYKLHEQLVKVLPEGEPWQLTLLSFLDMFEQKTQSGVYPNMELKTVCFSADAEKRLFSKGWNDITDLVADSRVKLVLQQAFLALFSRKIVITVKNGTVWLTQTVEDALWHIKQLMSLLDSEKKVFVVDAYEPSVNFESIFGKVEYLLWGPKGDPLKTCNQQLIIYDSSHWGASDFFKDVVLQEKYRQIIKRIVEEFSAQRVMVVALNKKMSDAIHGWGLPKEVLITWYRSDLMRGTQAKGRDVMVLLNGPYIPRRAYDASSKSFKLEDFVSELDGLEAGEEKAYMLPYLLWVDDLRGEFTNAVGRTKDPYGVRRSVVFGLGMQRGTIRTLLKDNCPSRLAKPHLTGTCFNGGLFNEGLLIAKLWMGGADVGEVELPILARIISETNQKKRVPASCIIAGQTKRVKEVATKHQELLERYNVLINRKTGGVEFRLKED